MATEDTLGYAALAQMLRGREERRQDERLRQQNNLQDEREARKTADNVFMDVYKTQEQEKAKQAALNQASLDRMALERSRSADRNLALRIHDENADLSREQQKALAEAARAQREEQDRTRHHDRVANLTAQIAKMTGPDGGLLYPSFDDAHKIASLLADKETPPTQAAPETATSAAPQTVQPVTPPRDVGPPASAVSAFPAPKVSPFKGKSEAVDYSKEIAGGKEHYTRGKQILSDLQAVPESMFGSAAAELRAVKAHTGNQTPQDQQERRIENRLNSETQDWLSHLLYKRSGKAITEREFRTLASAIGMSPNWIERTAKSAAAAAAVLAGGVVGGPLGAMSGERAAEVMGEIVGPMSYSILNRPNKQEAVQALADYLENHKNNVRATAQSYEQEDPFAGEGALISPIIEGPSAHNVAPEFLEKLRKKARKHLHASQPAQEAAPDNDAERDSLLDNAP